MTTPYPYGYNIEKTEKYPLVIENGRVKLKLEKGGSAIIFEGEKPYETAKEYKGEYVDISGEWKITERPINSLTIDKARLSYDGKDYGEKAYIPAIFNSLIGKKYVGKIYLKYEFNVKNKTDEMFVECERMDITNCFVNGEKVVLNEIGKLDRSFLTAAISDKVKTGANEVVFEIDFYESEHVLFVLSDVTPEKESLKNCLSYDTELESIYIRGNFCVFDDELTEDKAEPNVLVSEGNYYIDNFKPTVNGENITKDGYLFFAGKLELERKSE